MTGWGSVIPADGSAICMNGIHVIYLLNPLPKNHSYTACIQYRPTMRAICPNNSYVASTWAKSFTSVSLYAPPHRTPGINKDGIKIVDDPVWDDVGRGFFADFSCRFRGQTGRKRFSKRSGTSF